MLFTIPSSELRFRTARSGGPGGQHVNKTSTKVEVLWNVARSESLSDTQRELLLTKLSTRIDARGMLRVASTDSRSQLQNREAAVDRINAIVQKALRVPKIRKKTRPPKRAVEGRLAEKKKRAEKKERRKNVEGDE
jgi:ribosome-associated protein